jgi:MSHA pilin protein MshC
VQGGFTLIELVMVLVLVGVLAVFAAPRFLAINDLNARGFHDETLAYLRYAHKTAIAQRRTVCVTRSANSLVLTVAAAAATSTCSVNLVGPKGESPAAITAKGGVDYSTPPGIFHFNGLGQPIDSGTGAPVGTQTVQVAGASGSITIESETGYVHE